MNIDRRLLIQLSTAGYTLSSALIAGGLILLRIQESTTGWIFFALGVCFFVASVFLANLGLPPTNQRWTMSQAMAYYVLGAELEKNRANNFFQNFYVAVMGRLAARPMDEGVARADAASDFIFDKCGAGELRLEGIRIGEPDDEHGKIAPIPPNVFLLSQRSFNPRSHVEFKSTEPEKLIYRYVHVMTYRDEIKRARREYEIFAKVYRDRHKHDTRHADRTIRKFVEQMRLKPESFGLSTSATNGATKKR